MTNVKEKAERNENFRLAIWTGCHLQMTLMCIPPGGEIGMEMHADTDQLLRIEQGQAIAKIGRCQWHQEFEECLEVGDVVFVPAGTWHNIINSGSCDLKLSSVYAPPNHPKGTVQRTKAEAQET